MYNLLFLLEQHIHQFIPTSFYQKYYSKFGRTRTFSLESMLYAFIIKNILAIPSIDLLITLFNISSELRNFCGFLKVPHKSQFSRFKINFSSDIHDLFNILVDHTEALATASDEFLASILIADTTGFESYVTENNPKFYQKLLKQSKSYAKKFAKDNQSSSFDADDNYAYLHNRQIMPIININSRNSSNLPQPTFNEFGVPLCPNNPTLPMIYDGLTGDLLKAELRDGTAYSSTGVVDFL